jgi:hypothetical protein
MGWNDRLSEDPDTAFANEQDRVEYELWQQYILECNTETEALAQISKLSGLLTRLFNLCEEIQSVCSHATPSADNNLTAEALDA